MKLTAGATSTTEFKPTPFKQSSHRNLAMKKVLGLQWPNSGKTSTRKGGATWFGAALSSQQVEKDERRRVP